ncbi:MAG: ABC transporter permease [Planctomycetota bacterium]
MRTYVIRRLLAFVPTLFLITVLVFGVVNAVPAVPQNLGEGQDAGRLRESYAIFYRQFSLDLPVFVNLRHAVGEEKVRALLNQLLAEGERVGSRASTELANLGRHAVPPLLRLAGSETQPGELRELAFVWLGRVARQRVKPGEGADRVRWKGEENRSIDSLAATAGSAASLAELSSRWQGWYAERAERFEPSVLERVRTTFLETRFAVYLGNLLRLDLGVSMANMQPILPTLLGRLQHTFLISLLAILLAYLLSVPLGVLTAVLRGRPLERVLSIGLFALYSLPTFFAATLLLRFFSIGDPFDWFPSGDVRTLKGFEQLSGLEQFLDRAHHLVLPVFCLTYGSLAVLSRFARNSLLEVLGSDFVRTARAKGLGERTVLFRHGLRNALLPLLTLMGNILPAVFSGAVIVEIVFDIPGMGSYIYQAILSQDYNVIMATTLIAAVLTLVGYLFSDLAYALADPRICLDRRRAE